MTSLIISTGRGEFPVYAPSPRSLTTDEARGAVAEHVAALLAVLADLQAGGGPFVTDLTRLGNAMNETAAALCRGPDPTQRFATAYQLLELLCAVVDAHPEAAQQVADHLRPTGV